jgi:heme/copper-type cytochrome/quinol oxidase subunit 3
VYAFIAIVAMFQLGRRMGTRATGTLAALIFATSWLVFDTQIWLACDALYGSIVWVMLGLHTTHILTDLIDTLVLMCLMFSRHGDNPRRYGDVNDNAMYWNFVVATWLPMYVCLYWIPRL